MYRPINNIDKINLINFVVYLIRVIYNVQLKYQYAANILYGNICK